MRTFRTLNLAAIDPAAAATFVRRWCAEGRGSWKGSPLERERRAPLLAEDGGMRERGVIGAVPLSGSDKSSQPMAAAAMVAAVDVEKPVAWMAEPCETERRQSRLVALVA